MAKESEKEGLFVPRLRGGGGVVLQNSRSSSAASFHPNPAGWKPSNLIPVHNWGLGAAGCLTNRAVSCAITSLSDARKKNDVMFTSTKLCYVCTRSNAASVGTEWMPNCSGAAEALNCLQMIFFFIIIFFVRLRVRNPFISLGKTQSRAGMWEKQQATSVHL